MITVLVADDSFLMRKLISDILNADGDIEVVGTASNGEEVISMAGRLNPDVITMDLEMPRIGGLEATRRIMSELGPRPIVLMLSAFTTDKADITLDCLKAGAFDCILKPSGSLSLNISDVEKQLVAQVKAAASARRTALHAKTEGKPSAAKTSAPSQNGAMLIVIGASTGGPPVLERIFASLSNPVPAAILIVQHMPEKFTQSMAARIDGLSCMKVRQADDGETIKPGIALVAPGNYHMTIVRQDNGEYRVKLSQGAPVQGMRPSIDVLMNSAAAQWQGPVTGILLTGMGEDGREGMQTIRRRGGHTIVQDPETCVVDSMVRSVLDISCADETLPPDRIAPRMQELARPLSARQ